MVLVVIAFWGVSASMAPMPTRSFGDVSPNDHAVQQASRCFDLCLGNLEGEVVDSLHKLPELHQIKMLIFHVIRGSERFHRVDPVWDSAHFEIAMLDASVVHDHDPHA